MYMNNNESNNIELEEIIDNKELEEIEVYDEENNTTETYNNFLKRIKKNKTLFFVFILIFIFLLLFLVYEFFIVKKTIKIINNNTNNTQIVIENFILNKDGVFNELHYKYDLVFEIVGMDNALKLIYGPSDDPSIIINYDYIHGKDLNQVYEQYFNSYKNKQEVNINNYKYIYI